jgi:predicted secreted protein
LVSQPDGLLSRRSYLQQALVVAALTDPSVKHPTLAVDWACVGAVQAFDSKRHQGMDGACKEGAQVLLFAPAVARYGALAMRTSVLAL